MPEMPPEAQYLDAGIVRRMQRQFERSEEASLSMKLRCLDLFCGAGGATKGLQRAGFHVTGVDIKPQPRYCGDAFHQADAMTFPLTWECGDRCEGSICQNCGGAGHGSYAMIWASPPCQSYSAAMRHLAKAQPMLIDAMRDRLEWSGAQWVIENVVGAPLRDPIILCGTMFGMRVHRHRLFETSGMFALVPACFAPEPALNPHRASSRQRIYAEFGRQDPEKLWGREMGVPWMNRHETREAIPPAYSEFIGRQIIGQLK